MTGIRHWLEELGLIQYADAFAANDIDSSLLTRLNDQALKDIGVTSTGHRLRILRAIEGFAVDKPAPTAQAIHANRIREQDGSRPGKAKGKWYWWVVSPGSASLGSRARSESGSTRNNIWCCAISARPIT